MTVYFVFVPNARVEKLTVDLEFTNSLEIAQRTIQNRARSQRSKTFYEGHTPLRQGPQPEAEFVTADLTAYVLVWRRSGDKAVPKASDAPDEVWRLTPRGAVVRRAWKKLTEPPAVKEWRRSTRVRARRWLEVSERQGRIVVTVHRNVRA